MAQRRARAEHPHLRIQLAAKAERVQRILDELYPDPPIPHEHEDAFTLLIAVLLSAQTTDKRVNLVTPALFARADTPAAMSRLPVTEIHALIRTCGLAPAKAKHIAALSRILVERHGGEVPRTLEELEDLPGVGHKTASVVLCQAFGMPAFPVDTHIHRLAERWGLSDGRSVEQTERDLKAIFPESSWNRLHLQIIYFGREHCQALRHDPAGCPLCSWAAVERPPPKRAPKNAPATRSPPPAATSRAAGRVPSLPAPSRARDRAPHGKPRAGTDTKRSAQRWSP